MSFLSKSLKNAKNWLLSSDYKPVLSKKKYEELEDSVRSLELGYQAFEKLGYESSDPISQLGHLQKKQDYVRDVWSKIKTEIQLSGRFKDGFEIPVLIGASLVLSLIVHPVVAVSALALSSVYVLKSFTSLAATQRRAIEQTQSLVERVLAVQQKIEKKRDVVLSGINMATFESAFNKDLGFKRAFLDAVARAASESSPAGPQPKPQTHTP